MNITTRLLKAQDIPLMVILLPTEDRRARREKIYQRYLEEQNKDERVVIVAFYEEDFVGHVTIIWHPEYPPFAENNIPEISDLRVMPAYRRRGIGSTLMNEAEKRIFERSDVSGIGFGISADYGPAQRMFVKRGYIPDGRGLWSSEKGHIGEFSTVQVDDCVIFLTKNHDHNNIIAR